MSDLDKIAARFRDADRDVNSATRNLREAQKILDNADKVRQRIWQELMDKVKEAPDAK